jgi:hypothetical protein
LTSPVCPPVSESPGTTPAGWSTSTESRLVMAPIDASSRLNVVQATKEKRNRLPHGLMFRFLAAAGNNRTLAIALPHLPGRTSDRAISMMSSREAVGSRIRK